MPLNVRSAHHTQLPPGHAEGPRWHNSNSSRRTPCKSILVVDRELSHFYRAVRRIPWLHPLATRMIGVRPPRYPTLWERTVMAMGAPSTSRQTGRRMVCAVTGRSAAW